MTGQLREGGHGLGNRSSFPNDQLSLTDVDGLFLAEVIKVQGPQYRNRDLAVILLVELGFQKSAFNGDARLRLNTRAPQPLDAFIHTRQCCELLGVLVYGHVGFLYSGSIQYVLL
jgi:hypothetical protein